MHIWQAACLSTTDAITYICIFRRNPYLPSISTKHQPRFQVIEKALSEDLWARRHSAIDAARRKVLDEYNLSPKL